MAKQMSGIIWEDIGLCQDFAAVFWERLGRMDGFGDSARVERPRGDLVWRMNWLSKNGTRHLPQE